MARDFNQFRNASAKLARKTIDKLGTTFAVEYGLDGFNAVNNVVAPMPTDIKEYLEGDTSITIYACASNIDKLCEYALASFPNIEDLYLFKTSAIVVLEDDLSYLLDLNKIYVPSDLLSAYLSAYPTLSSKFDTIVEDYTLTIPFIGETTLKSEYVDSVIAMLSSAEKNAITKVVIPTDFTQESANEIAWGYDFSAIVNLNNNIWYGTTKVNFTEYTIQGSGTLTSEIVESSIASISNDKLSSITKLIVPSAFTSIDNGALNGITNILTSLTEFEANCPFGNYEEGIFNVFEGTNIGYLDFDYYGAKVKLPINDIENDTFVDLSVGYDNGSRNDFVKNFKKIYSNPTWTGTFDLNWNGKSQAFLYSQYSGYGTCSATTLIVRGTPTTTSGWHSYAGGYGGAFQMFTSATTIQFIDWDTSNVTSFSNLIGDGKSLITLDLTNLVSINGTIQDLVGRSAVNLTTLKINCQNVTSSYDFAQANSNPKLKTVILNGMKENVTLSKVAYGNNGKLTSMNREDIVNLINSLGTPTTTKTLNTYGRATDVLTADDIAIATQKNWVVQ